MDNANTFDYALMQKETLLQLKGALSADVASTEYVLNLVNTAIDYNFYLVDERII
jgi:hypothetical protein